MLNLRPQSKLQSSVFCRACDCISPTYQSYWSVDCKPLIFGPHFFGVYLIRLFINGPKPVLAPISSFSLKATGFSCLGYLSQEEKRLEGHTPLGKKTLKSYTPQRMSFARKHRLIYIALSAVHLPWQYHT